VVTEAVAVGSTRSRPLAAIPGICAIGTVIAWQRHETPAIHGKISSG
jgi:hypothetical protein